MAKRVLGWEPTVALPEGLRLTVVYVREQAGGPKRAMG